MLKMKLNYWDLSNMVQYVTKKRQDNNMTNNTGAIYIKNETEMLWPIGSGEVYDGNQIGQRCDRS